MVHITTTPKYDFTIGENETNIIRTPPDAWHESVRPLYPLKPMINEDTPRIYTTDNTTMIPMPYVQPFKHESWTVAVIDDHKVKAIYEYLLTKEEPSFGMETLVIELAIQGVVITSKGELLSILVQMVSDGILTYDRTTAKYTLNQ